MENYIQKIIKFVPGLIKAQFDIEEENLKANLS
jgi:hypothetical protein